MKTKIINISKIISWNVNTNSIEIIKDKDILIESGKIISISKDIDSYDEIIDGEKCIITPGFIDTHTHPIFVGSRANEFEMRSQGKTYQEISKMGGGINSSVNSLRNSSEEELYLSSLSSFRNFSNLSFQTLSFKTPTCLSLIIPVLSTKKVSGAP